MHKTVNGKKLSADEEAKFNANRLAAFVGSDKYGKHLERVKNSNVQFIHTSETFASAQGELDKINAQIAEEVKQNSEFTTTEYERTPETAKERVKAAEKEEQKPEVARDFFSVQDSAINIEVTESGSEKLDKFINENPEYQQHLATVSHEISGEVAKVLQVVEQTQRLTMRIEVEEFDEEKHKQQDLKELEELMKKQQEEYFALVKKQDEEQHQQREARLEALRKKVQADRMELEMLEMADRKVEEKLLEIRSGALAKENDPEKIEKRIRELYEDDAAEASFKLSMALGIS